MVFSGVSGSGKSSLAFDTIYVEGQRRYVESLSAFARRYLGDLPKPDLEQASGLSPTISIEQKTAGRNPRSTVGTMTEIYDYMRVLFSRIGTPHCPVSGEAVLPQSRERIIKTIESLPDKTPIILLAPYARGKKAEFVEDFQALLRKGFTRVRVDGKMIHLEDEIKLDRSVAHDVDIFIDRIDSGPANHSRIIEGVSLALEMGQGVFSVINNDTQEETLFSMHAFSPKSGLSYHSLEPHDFSFNSPSGMCIECNGLGQVQEFDLKLIIDPEKSIAEDCCSIASSYSTVRYSNIYNHLAKTFGFNIQTPWKKLPQKAQTAFLYGLGEKWVRMEFVHPLKNSRWHDYIVWRGVIHEARERYQVAKSKSYQSKMEKLMTRQVCPVCQGTRLKAYPAATTVSGKKIWEVTSMTILECYEFFKSLKLLEQEAFIASELLKEITQRLQFLIDVGLHYLTLERTAPTLSGGEAQRVRLASQIGCGLVGVTYVLDEPSIGLHPRDNSKLIQTLKNLRDLGNTVIVVEHDEETILEADRIVDFGPGPGFKGGEIICNGTLADLLKNKSSYTGAYLSGKKTIPIPTLRKTPRSEALQIIGATHHNLKNLDVSIPLGLFIAITGVSGSGKSSLITDILYPYLSNTLHHGEHVVGAHNEIKGIEFLDKVIAIDQTPIGRNPRSNPSTYIKVFDEVRDLFSQLPESIVRGFKPGRFSFNVKEGSCANCEGMGMLKIDMDFMEDAWIACPICKSRRFDHETLSILYKGKNIADILEMTVQEAWEFFQHIPSIAKKLKVMIKVGLEYIQLGQPSTTLSGGEAQRIKLAKELSRPSTGKTLYILDEPTTGLHFHDIKHLLEVLHELVARGNSIIVIEHNMDVVKTADWIIDIGPEGGAAGGQIVDQGSPEHVSKKTTPTGIALSHAFSNHFQELIKKRIKIKKTLKQTQECRSAQFISIKDAEQNNLKQVSVEIPREAITVFSGPSGSGKSSLAFETIYAEGQRRYIESLSPYIRQFVNQMPKPKLGMAEGLSPAISIEQKAHAGNPRSTVGTMTEIYDFLRILYARAGIAHCPETGEIIKAISKDHVVDRILAFDENEAIYILAPLEISKNENFTEVVEKFKRRGFLRLRLNGNYYEMDAPIPFEKGRKNKLELVVDRLKINAAMKSRLFEAIETASEISHGKVLVNRLHSEKEESEDLFFNLAFAVEKTGKSYPEITPHTFAFNTLSGMCLDCEGLGYQYGADLISRSEFSYLTVEGLLLSLWRPNLSGTIAQAIQFASPFFTEEQISLKAFVKSLPAQKLNLLMNGSAEDKWYFSQNGLRFRWQGINASLAKAGRSAYTPIKEALKPLLEEIKCFSCNGTRLNPLARNVLINQLSIGEACRMPVEKCIDFIRSIELSQADKKMLDETMSQLNSRLEFLCEVGLHYISLERSAPSLSNGESQRIRLARQLGSGLTGVLYVLDEPTIGLHPRDNALLNEALKKLKDLGNTLILVEHDPQTIALADYLVDFGPQAGIHGGHITAQGTLEEIKADPKSLTGSYLSGKNRIPHPKKRRQGNGNFLTISKAVAHNLKDISMSFPLGCLNFLTGVSGSGKSTLMHQIIRPAVESSLDQADKIALATGEVSGISHIDKLICIDQNPIGHTSRSDVVTYIDVLTRIREFFCSLPQARAKGLQPKHFSYNHRKGMCSSCLGLGYKKIMMHFLPPVTVECQDCSGMRLNPASLEVQYQGKNLGEILQLTAEEVRQIFENHPRIVRILDTLISVGLGYLKLGQEIATLSGGEAQRIKLSRELAKRSTGKTLYLLDEPTTGLHSDDICKLLDVLHKLVDKGNTMIIIEHHIEMIKNADYIVDLGPEAGEKGGEVVCTGTPEQVAKNAKSYTGHYLKKPK